MLFDLNPHELQAIFSAITTTQAALAVVRDKLTEQYQAQISAPPQEAPAPHDSAVA